MGKKEKYVRICPICNSTDVSPDFSSPAAIVSGALYMYKCNRCGFIGNSALFPKVRADQIPKPKDLSKIKRNYPLANLTYGRGVSGMWKFFGPLGTLLSLILLFMIPYPVNLFDLFWGMPVFIFITLYSFYRKYFETYKTLKIIGIIMIIYAFVGPYFWVLLLLKNF